MNENHRREPAGDNTSCITAIKLRVGVDTVLPFSVTMPA